MTKEELIKELKERDLENKKAFLHKELFGPNGDDGLISYCRAQISCLGGSLVRKDYNQVSKVLISLNELEDTVKDYMIFNPQVKEEKHD